MEGSKGAKQQHSLVFPRTCDDLRAAAGGRYMQQQARMRGACVCRTCAAHDRDARETLRLRMRTSLSTLSQVREIK